MCIETLGSNLEFSCLKLFNNTVKYRKLKFSKFTSVRYSYVITLSLFFNRPLEEGNCVVKTFFDGGAAGFLHQDLKVLHSFFEQFELYSSVTRSCFFSSLFFCHKFFLLSSMV